MPVLTRSQARARQPLTHAVSSKAGAPGQASTSSSELPQQPSLEGSVSCSDRAFGGHPSTLAVGNESSLAVCTCRANYLTCPALIRENQFGPNNTGIEHFVIDNINDSMKFTAIFKIVSAYQHVHIVIFNMQVKVLHN